MFDLTATREQGSARLQDFAPSMGRRYANGRNFDHGPGKHTAVSVLSPWIRRRLVTEAEVVAAALAAHGPEAAEKFVEELFWRGYFKGWLELRPLVWDRYREGLRDNLAALDQDPRLRSEVARALAGDTSIACFNAWAHELIETGYLHNHSRMWFASVWIFTLGLPWRIGADFFYRHLLDGDPASNTLSWRWVAGLHTRGKPYRAQAWNIQTFTGQRFQPREGDLADVVGGLEATEPDGLPPVLPLRTPTPPKVGLPTGLLITEEDCRIEDFALDGLDIRAAATLAASQRRSPGPVSAAVVKFEDEALADAAARAGFDTALALRAEHPDGLARWAKAAGVKQIVTPYIPRGPLYDWLSEAKPALTTQGILLAEWRRDWDSAIWPHATAEFFKLKQRIPRILDELGLQ